MELDLYEIIGCADSGSDGLCIHNKEENMRVEGLVRERLKAKRRGRKPLRTAFAAAAVLAVLGVTALAAGRLGWFELALGEEAEQYAENINEVNEASRAGALSAVLDSVIYKEDGIYALIITEAEAPLVSGSILSAETGEVLHGLICETKAVEREEGVWLCTGKLDYPFDVQDYISAQPPEQKAKVENIILAAGDYSMANSLKACFGDTLELTVSAGGESVTLSAPVDKVSYEEISIAPDRSLFPEGQYYDAILIEPNHITFAGRYTGEPNAGDPDWFKPDFELILTMSDGSAHHFSVESGELFHGEAFSAGAAWDGDEQTGEIHLSLTLRDPVSGGAETGLELGEIERIELNAREIWCYAED